MDKLEDYRKKIDKIDKEILNQFLKRMDIVKKIADVKKENNIDIFDEKREKEILKKKTQTIENEEIKEITKRLFEKIMDLSKDYQWEENNKKNIIISSDVKVGYLGKKGSFSHIATKEYFDKEELVCHNTFEEIFIGVKEGKIKYGVLPIENTSTGSIIEVYDLLRKYRLSIVGEKKININHHLMAKKGVKLSDIKTVYSHPQAIKQSKEFLKHFSWQLINKENTSESAYKVSKSDRKDIAAIGSFEAAKIYNLEILKDNINHNSQNITRFIVVSKDKINNKKANKLTIGFSVNHEPGALYNVLGIFERNNINLYKLESRPILNYPFEYYFYADLKGNLEELKVKNIINKVKEKSNSFEIYGNYERDNR